MVSSNVKLNNSNHLFKWEDVNDLQRVEQRPLNNSFINIVEENMEMKKQQNIDNERASWLLRAEQPWWARLAIWCIKLGPIPRHIAFVMDGNRRYARSHQCLNVLDGHQRGFEQLTRVLDWCDWLGIQEVTVYAFSIENFKRSKQEVDGLLVMGEQKLQELLKISAKLIERRMRIRFFGNRKLLPECIQNLMQEIEAINRHRECSTFLNICLAYTSQDELLRAIESIHLEVRSGRIDIENINQHQIKTHLDTHECLPLDMVVRTSECRLSDFMLMQILSTTYMHFELNILWPEFSLRHLLVAILAFQISRIELQAAATNGI